jgi:hypothetical protein
MNFTKYSKHFVLIVVTILVSAVFWFSFYSNLPARFGFPQTSLETVFSNYDGPNYMVITKCGYDKSCIAHNFSLPLPLEYYPAHLPGFPLIIKYFSYYTNTPKAMLLATLFGSVFLTLVSFQFFKLFLGPRSSFYLSMLMIFFPGRLLVLRLIGAPETWFIALTLLSIILYKRQRYFFSAFIAALSMTLKSPGILLFVAFGVMAVIEYIKTRDLSTVLKKYSGYLLIPLTAIFIFYVYYLQTGDFFAYFHSGDNLHLNLLPYMVFISNHTWINTIWLEDVIYIYLIAIIGVSRLYKKFKLDLFFIYPLIFTLAAVFVAHRDISRYIAPVYPFLILAYSKTLLNQKTKMIFLLILPALILYAINFIIGNTAPIADWTPYL